MPALTFTKTTPGTYQGGVGATSAPTTETFVGSGMRVRGNPQRYKDLELIESEAPTLLWTADEAGDPTPSLGAMCTWGGREYRVRDVQPLDPDGEGHILARIIVERP